MNKLKSLMVPVSSVLVFLVLWEAATLVFKVPEYLLPGPRAVANAIWKLYSTGAIFPHISMTLQEIGLGYFVGCTIAVILGTELGVITLASALLAFGGNWAAARALGWWIGI